MSTSQLVIALIGILGFGILVVMTHRGRASAYLQTSLVLLLGALLAYVVTGEISGVGLFALSIMLVVITWRISDSQFAPFWVVVIIVLLLLTKLPIWGGSAVATGNAGLGVSAWLGFSYLAFRLIHIVVDTRAGRLKELPLPEMLTYALHPSSLIAGPIDRLPNSIEAQRSHAELREDLHHGGWRLLRGVILKFVVANPLFVVVSATSMPANPDRPVGIAWIWLFAYTFYLLADFAAYSDIAIGAGRMAGLRLPENFNRPYQSRSLTVFWQRWHISLSNWLRDYVFFPIVRSARKRFKKRFRNGIQFVAHMTTMVATGLWHGLTSGFLVWGIWHGLGMFVSSQLNLGRPNKGDTKVIASLRLIGNIAGTFVFVMFGWVFFATDFPTAIRIFARLFGVG